MTDHNNNKAPKGKQYYIKGMGKECQHEFNRLEEQGRYHHLWCPLCFGEWYGLNAKGYQNIIPWDQNVNEAWFKIKEQQRKSAGK